MIFNMVVSGGGSGSGDLPWQTFVGNPLEFDAPKSHTLQSVTVEFEPIQDTSGGDPSPSHICPITGHTEVNVFIGDIAPLEFIDGKYYNDSGSLSSSSNTRYEADYIPVESNGNYYFVFDSTSSNKLRVHEYDANKTWLRQIISTNVTSTVISYTASSDASYIRYSYPIASGDSNICKTITNVPLGGTYYGGTLDVATGVLTVDKTVEDMGTLTWSGSSSTYWGINKTVIGAKQVNNIDLICSAYPTTNDKTSSFSIYDTTNAIRVYDSSYADAPAFETAMSGVQLVYELATPLTYNLTAQQVQAIVGLNVMWTDCVSLTVQARGTNV